MKRQVGLTLPKAVDDAVDRWRMSQPIPPSKSAALAAMIEEGLKVYEERSAAAGNATQPTLPFGGS